MMFEKTGAIAPTLDFQPPPNPPVNAARAAECYKGEEDVFVPQRLVHIFPLFAALRPSVPNAVDYFFPPLSDIQTSRVLL